MLTFINKHWEKITLALCAAIWNGCDNESSIVVEEPAYGSPAPCYYNTKGCEEPEPITYPAACSVTEYCPEAKTLECNGYIVSEPPESFDSCKTIKAPCLRTYNCADGLLCDEESKNNAKVFTCSGLIEIDGEFKNHVTYTEEEFNKKYYDSSKQ